MEALIHKVAAEALVKAHDINTIPEAVDFLMDDRSHGDELTAIVAAEVALEKYGATSGPSVPAGSREEAAAFIAEVFSRGTARLTGQEDGKD